MEEALNSLLHRSKNEIKKAEKQSKLENAKLPKKPRVEKRSVSSFYTFLTPAGKVTNKLSTCISPKMAERSEAKSAKRSFASK